MIVETEIKEKLATDFLAIKDKVDLLNVLNEARRILLGDAAYPIRLNQLTYYISPNRNKSRYRSFTIKKKSGKERVIHAPADTLKDIQQALNLLFQHVIKIHSAATGFVPGVSVVDNARVHTGMNYVYNIDLKDFFFSINQRRVWSLLQRKPFNFNDETERLELANMIAGLCCEPMDVERFDENQNSVYRKESVLPQGAPTSPTLTNIVCRHLDYKLNKLAQKYGLNYTRYADDITFSSMHHVYRSNGIFIQELTRILKEENFVVQKEKTRLQKRYYRQEVTGLIVNNKVNVSRKYVKELRHFLYLWERYGYSMAQILAGNSYYKADNGKPLQFLTFVINGKLNYMAMVVGTDNPTYKKLLARYRELASLKNMDEIMTVWQEKGIDEAVKKMNA